MRRRTTLPSSATWETKVGPLHLARRGATLAAALSLALAAAACAPTPPDTRRGPTPPQITPIENPSSERGEIQGRVLDLDGQPLEDAVLVLTGPALSKPRERLSQPWGGFRFPELLPGEYTVQVLYDSANVSRVVRLPERSVLRFDFVISPNSNAGPAKIVVKKSLMD